MGLIQANRLYPLCFPLSGFGKEVGRSFGPGTATHSGARSGFKDKAPDHPTKEVGRPKKREFSEVHFRLLVIS